MFERDGDGEGVPFSYAVAAYLPDGGGTGESAGWRAQLRWGDEGATLEEVQGQAPAPAWISAEALKLARVLRRDPKPRLVRWRAGPG